MEIKPFFINSNICTNVEDTDNLDAYLKSVAFNIGNSYPTISIIKQIQGGFVCPHHIQNIWNYDFSSQEKDIDIINNQCTHVFFMLQDQIRISEGYNQVLPFEQIKSFIKKINKPIIVMSIGANQYFDFDVNKNKFIDTRITEKDFCKHLSSELIDFLHFLSEHTEILGIRGEYTKQVFANLNIKNTQVIGCPSFYENGPNRKIKKVSNNALKDILILTPYNAFKSNEMWELPQQSKFNIHYMVQDEYTFLKAFFSKNYVNLLEKYSSEVLTNCFYFSDIASWKTFSAKHQLALGYRIHGSILSINSGVPTIFTPPDVKGLEMAEFMHIPHSNLVISNDLDFLSVYEDLDLSNMNISYNDLFKNYEMFLAANSVNLYNGKNYDYEEQPKLNLKDNNLVLSNTICQKELDRSLGERISVEQDFLAKKILELSSKLDYLLQQNNKPTFWQHIFSIRNIGNHKIWMIFGIKIKIKRKSRGVQL